MIDKSVFANQMGLLADRVGRQLHEATLREYFRHLSNALTTEQFVAATTLVFHAKSAEYRNWPSPREIIELIIPVERPAIGSAEMFEKVLAITNDPRIPIPDQRQRVQELGATAVRAFYAAGGFRDFRDVLEVDVTWLRKRFVEIYDTVCEFAEAEQTAQLAMNDATNRFATLANSIAAKLAMPQTKKLEAAS